MIMKDRKELYSEAVALLREIISIPSFSKEERLCANYICKYFDEKGIVTDRIKNNIVIKQNSFNPKKPTLMLASHIDTVKPASSYTVNPFEPKIIENEKLFGLGSNDAGASVVCLIQSFIHLYSKDFPFNLLLVLSAEEEISGENGINQVINIYNYIDFAIIGEPTGMNAAIAERGLIVIDGEARGKSGHAARSEGINAINIAIEDIHRIQSTKFSKTSDSMGDIKLTVTQINAGSQHNVIPDLCSFVIDIRTTDEYTNTEIVNQLRSYSKSILTPRSLKNKSSSTPPNHLLIQSVDNMRIKKYVSPTTSDWMRINCPAIKIGPGESSRSHQSDEFILISELEDGINKYIDLIENLAEIYPKNNI